MAQFAASLSLNHSITHLDISGFKLSSAVILELMKAIQLNHYLQEIKLDVHADQNRWVLNADTGDIRHQFK